MSFDEATDFARELFVQTVAEPYRTKVVEHLRLPSRAERAKILQEAHYSPVYLSAGDVYIDFATDSGGAAMSSDQWAALMRGDESYFCSKNFPPLQAAIREIMGLQHVVPTHQGRAAENIVMDLFVKPGDVVLSNTHFDTTKAHVETRGASAVDLMSDSLWDFREAHPFKGNFDLSKLQAALARHHDRVRMIVITVLNNFAASSPVSLANIRAVRSIADEYQVPVFIDACRIAENAFFIKEREEGYANKSISEIVREILSFGRACWMSAKKDAIVNIGGFLATNDDDLAMRFRERAVLYEGFYTYGGLARRDLEAMAIGLREGVDESYLRHRTGLVRYLGEQMEAAGVVVSKPIGGSGVFADIGSIYPHLESERNPGIALFCDLYLEGGIRAAGVPFPVRTVSPRDGSFVDKLFNFTRFAVPRRVYSKSHMDYAVGMLARVKDNAPAQKGYRLVSAPEVLGHFFAKFVPYG
ncbi:MAG TPA: tryptophanase [Polyangiaceae bacterium]|nr:tryptophanase [Polyangiaceae bacterium]